MRIHMNKDLIYRFFDIYFSKFCLKTLPPCKVEYNQQKTILNIQY